MNKKKIGIVGSALATTAICASLIAGSTYALFTSEDKVNVAVTSAQLGVTASIENITTSYYGAVTGLNTSLKADLNEATKTLEVTGMQPGDIVSFEVAIASEATVDFQYRMSFGCDEEDNALFNELLLGVADKPAEVATVSDDDTAVKAPVYTYYTSKTGAWTSVKAEDKDKIPTKLVTIEYPAYSYNNANQGKTCHISFAVEAVQNNAVVANEASEVATKAYRVHNQTELTAALNEIKDGETLVLDLPTTGTKWAEADIANATVKNIIVTGYNVGKVTFNLPEAEVDYYNKLTDEVNVTAVKNESLHIYGKVADLEVKQGNVVAKSGSEIKAVSVAPDATDKTAKITVEKNSEVGKVTVPETAVGNVEVAIEEKAVVESLDVQSENVATAIESNGSIKDINAVENAEISIAGDAIGTVEKHVDSLEALVAALNSNISGMTIVLDEDIEVTEEYTQNNPLYVANDNTTLDLNGHTVTIYNNVSFKVTGENVTIKNGAFKRSEGRDYSYILKLNGVNTTLDTVTVDSSVNVSGYNPDDSVKAGVSANLIKCNLMQTATTWAYYNVCAQGEAVVTIEDSRFTREAIGKANYYLWIEKEFTDELGYVGNSSITVKNCTFSSDVDTSLYLKGYAVPVMENSELHVDTVTELNNAISYGVEGLTIVLDGDIDVAESDVFVDSTSPVVIDLNGHTVTGSGQIVFWVGNKNVPTVTLKNGNITATAANGMAVYSPVKSNITLENVNITKSVYGAYVMGSLSVKGGSIAATSRGIMVFPSQWAYEGEPEYWLDVTIEGTEITSNSVGIEVHTAKANITKVNVNAAAACILVFRDSTVVATECTLTSESGSGLQGNGTTKTDNSNCGINTDITLNNCEITAVAGIYHPQTDGKLTVNGGTIVASSVGVEVRGGAVVLNGVEVTCTATQFEIEANGSGSTVKGGAALAVSQHTTNDDIQVTVTGETVLNGVYALYEKDVQDNQTPKNITITIEETCTLNGGVYSENCENIESVEPTQA